MSATKKLEAGAALDQIIAEKVMFLPSFRGIWTWWKPVREWAIYDPKEHRQYVMGSDEAMPAIWQRPNGTLLPILPAWSTDTTDAFLLVDFMRRDGFSFKLWQPSNSPVYEGDPQRNKAVVSFICPMGPCEKHGNPHENHHGAYDVEEETLPLAIVRAALKAKKVAE